MAGVKRVHVHHGPFKMKRSQNNLTTSDEAQSPVDFLSPELIQQTLSLTDTVIALEKTTGSFLVH